MSVAPRTRLRGIQFLRGLAALAVAFLHDRTAIAASFPKQEWLAHFAIRGDFGVDIFFVISGFIISHIARDAPAGAASVGRFALNRAARILPLYWSASLLTVALQMAFADRTSARPSLGYIVQSLLFIPPEVFDSKGYAVPVLELGWTLDFEIFFYAVFACGIALAGGRRAWQLAIGVLTALIIIGLVLHPAGAIGRTWTNSMFAEFIFGMLIAQVPVGVLARRAGTALVVLGAVASMVYLLMPSYDYAWRCLAAGLPAAGLVLGTVLLDKTAVAAASGYLARFGERLGDCSYSLYLLHLFPLLAMTKFAAGRQALQAIGPVGALLFLLAVQVALAMASFAWLERPANAMAAGLLHRKRLSPRQAA